MSRVSFSTLTSLVNAGPFTPAWLQSCLVASSFTIRHLHGSSCHSCRSVEAVRYRRRYVGNRRVHGALDRRVIVLLIFMSSNPKLARRKTAKNQIHARAFVKWINVTALDDSGSCFDNPSHRPFGLTISVYIAPRNTVSILGRIFHLRHRYKMIHHSRRRMKRTKSASYGSPTPNGARLPVSVCTPAPFSYGTVSYQQKRPGTVSSHPCGLA